MTHIGHKRATSRSDPNARAGKGLEQLQESSNRRYEQEQQDGLQDSHHPRFVVVYSMRHCGFRTGRRRTASRSLNRKGPAGEPLTTYDPRCAPECICLGGQTTAPHHLSGPPPPAKAGFEIVRVAVPTASAATASMIASDVFMSRLLSDRR